MNEVQASGDRTEAQGTYDTHALAGPSDWVETKHSEAWPGLPAVALPREMQLRRQRGVEALAPAGPQFAL